MSTFRTGTSEGDDPVIHWVFSVTENEEKTKYFNSLGYCYVKTFTGSAISICRTGVPDAAIHLVSNDTETEREKRSDIRASEIFIVILFFWKQLLQNINCFFTYMIQKNCMLSNFSPSKSLALIFGPKIYKSCKETSHWFM